MNAIVGAAILAKVERGEWPQTRLLEMMSKTLTSPDDLALFGITQPNQSEETTDTSQAQGG